MRRTLAMFSIALSLAITAMADVSNVVDRLHLDAFVGMETAYKQRGFVADRHPFLVQSIEPVMDIGPFGFVGFDIWAASATSRSGQSYHRRNAFNEVYYDILYGYEYEFVKDWKLSTWVWLGWDTLPGYHDDECRGFSEWCVDQALENPYVTPYWHLQRCVIGGGGSYWELGLRRKFKLMDDLVLTVSAFTELCNDRHLRDYGGPNPYSADGRYGDGFLAVDLDVRLAYYFTEWFNVYVFVHQFNTVNSDVRDYEDLLNDMGMRESMPDVTYGGVGLQISF